MKPQELLEKIPKNKIEKPIAISQLAEVFDENDLSIHPLRMYAFFFNKIPHIYTEKEINCHKVSDWLIENYESKIKDFYIFKTPSNRSIISFCEYYILGEDLMITLDYTLNYVSFFYKSTGYEMTKLMIEKINKFKVRKERQPKISVVTHSRNGLSTESLKITKPKLNIADNYNDDFTEIHQTILKRLRKKNDKGLVLLHGKAGTGKTSYIRYLISLVKKKVIFLPPNMASVITNPDLLTLLIDNPNSIFVIEDAENLIIDREHNGNSPVSALLNISDGLLSDCLNIQIICSFNTDLSKVDTALMRKGRLIAKYEFKEMETQKSQILSDKLGFKTKINLPMTLTDIYNQNESSFQPKSRKAIGF